MNVIVALVVSWFAISLGTAPPAAARRDAPVMAAAGAFFGVSVADVDASAKWYAETFGLKVVMPLSKSDPAAATVLEGGGLIVELVQHKQATPRTKDPVLEHGLFKTGIVVDDFDAALAALKARGVDIAFGPFPARPNQRANVIIKDNAGNLIQIFGK